MSSPFFSIIIPTYNRATLIPKAIESVMAQTFGDWEMIIVDDGSTDSTKEVVEEYTKADNRIKYIYQQNAERCAARNNGVENATGLYLCFLDSDDYFLQERLELLRRSIAQKNNPVCLFYTGILYENGETIIKREEVENNFGNVFDFLAHSTIGTQQACIHRDIMKVEKFDPRFHVAEDFELWVRIARNYPIVHLENQFTVVLTEHGGRTVGDYRYEGYENHIKTYKYIFDNFGQYFSSDKMRRKFLHDSHMGLARSYLRNGKKWKMLKAIIVGSTYNLTRTGKEKTYLIASNFLLFKPALWVLKALK